ncbi:MAG: MotA/TolQ/ExbB proton channel family protein, partial [Paludibacteraceae bacterium]|nr:MotA/TolQ/ExbB proton channel family protein [Paludibacteraceae bacterium]
MKKVIAIITVLGLFTLGMSNVAAQDAAAPAAEATQVDSAAAAPAEESVAEAADVEEEGGIHKVLKQKFIEGGAGFMASVAFCLIFGLALAIERIIYL